MILTSKLGSDGKFYDIYNNEVREPIQNNDIGYVNGYSLKDDCYEDDCYEEEEIYDRDDD